MKQKHLVFLLVGIFFFRLLFGLASEFWFPDELQIYLLGLKWYTTGAWPAYGPDVVYTQTQIPGALQGLLTGAAFFVLPIPEAPFILLNVLSFFSLLWLVNYAAKWVPELPKVWLYLLVYTLPWAMNYSTRVCNPSYALIFSIPFFIAFLELIPNVCIGSLKPLASAFIMGVCTTLVMQLHLSYVLLLPFAGAAFLFYFLKHKWKVIAPGFTYIVGMLIGGLTLFPTLLYPDPAAKSVASNLVINWSNFENLVTILLRFLSFASYEIPYMLGGDTPSRLAVLADQMWMSPFAILLLLTGFAQVALFIFSFFLIKADPRFNFLKWTLFGTWILLFMSFFFSVKGPSSHTFYILFPLPVIYSLFAYRYILNKYSLQKYFKTMIIASVLFHVGLGLFSFHSRSLYLDRQKALKAIQQKDHKILGTRRAEEWGYGY